MKIAKLFNDFLKSLERPNLKERSRKLKELSELDKKLHIFDCFKKEDLDE